MSGFLCFHGFVYENIKVYSTLAVLSDCTEQIETLFFPLGKPLHYDALYFTPWFVFIACFLNVCAFVWCAELVMQEFL